MRQVQDIGGSLAFRGSLDDPEDMLAASAIARTCPAYAIDEEDEDYCDGARTCFNCRLRRWLADGFTCMKDLLHR